jgi:hypothetical protein
MDERIGTRPTVAQWVRRQLAARELPRVGGQLRADPAGDRLTLNIVNVNNQCAPI